MRHLNPLLVLSGLVVLSLLAGAEVLEADTQFHESILDFQIGRQLDIAQSQLLALQRAAASEIQSERIEAISVGLEAIERLYLAVHHGSPIRTEAQLHSRLGFLKAELRVLTHDLGLRHTPKPSISATGTFSGKVTGSDAPGGIEGVFIDIFDSGGEWVAAVTTVANGTYITPGLSAGDYYARSNDQTSYINELYDDISCYYICNITEDGQKITVSESANTPDIDFELELGNTISGTITDAAVAPPNDTIEGVMVDLFDENGMWVTNPSTDASGDYVTPGMPAGTYYAITFNLDQYQNERYDDQPCVDRCDPIAGTPIVILPGFDTEDIDFDLIKGGSISGKVTADPAGTPIENVVVEIYESNGDWRATGWSDHECNYITGGGLPASTTYRARTFAPAPYLNELHNNMPCYTGCDLATGTPIVVSLGAETTGKNFALPSGGTFSGRVTDGSTGLVGVGIEIFDTAGNWLNIAFTDGAGGYVSFGLPAGFYHARTWNDQGLINELYDDIPCSFCDVTAGALIQVTAGGVDTPDIDFALGVGGTISGTVTSSATGDELETVIVDLFDSAGTFVANPSTDDQGQYTSPGLPAGDYYARTWNSDGYVNELYDDHPCPPTCDPLTSGTVIQVQLGSETAGIDFELQKGGFVSGTVTQTGTGTALVDIHVEIWTPAGQLAAWEGTAADGTYTTSWVLPAGTYYVKTWNDQGYINKNYPNKPCAFCDPTEGVAIRITAGATTSGIDFELAVGGTISGTLTLADPNDAILTSIQIFDKDGQRVWSQRPLTTSGEYTIDVGLPSGKYYARTAGGRPYVNEVWNNQPCLYDCDVVNDGHPIQVTAPSTTTGVDFNLAPGVKLSGTIKDASTQTGIDDSVAEIFNPAGERVAGCRVGAIGSFTCWQAIPAGTYYAATANYAGYIDELFSNPRKTCVGGGQFCDVTRGTPIQVSLAVPPEQLHFTLDRGGWFAGSVIDEVARRGLAGTGILVYDDAGDLVTNVLWKQPLSEVQAGSYTSCGLPTGTYYAVTDTSLIGGYYADELYDDHLCVLGCDVLDGTPIDVISGSGTANIDFELVGLVFVDDFESGDLASWSSVR